MKKVFTNLTFWVLVAITAGILLGHFYPDTAVKMQVLGTTFISIVKIFINPIIFLTITLGISSMGDLKKTGRVGGKAILYFEIVTTFALLIGIVVAHFIQPGKGVNISEIKGGDISAYVKQSKEFSWWSFFKENITLQIVVFSIIAGIILNRFSRNERIIKLLKTVSD